jgi:tetratricopeptide (TPR) repeat protein
MKDKRKKKKVIANPTKPNLSIAKKRIFWITTVSLPFLIFAILEVSLRIFNYGGNLDLFIAGPPGYENYLRCNPEFAHRYFYTQSNVPTPPLQLFYKLKLENSYRIFVLGESSAAGFPYGNNASFPNILQRGLSNTFPQINIEVINVSMAAINSYTLLDLLDEIMEQSPDAILIYTGHNEYYGALGVGSAQSLGNWRWLINTYLKLQYFKTFILLRNFLGWAKTEFNNLFYEENETDPSATLMERIVAEQTIPYGSNLYEKGKEQFKENMEVIVQKAVDKGIKVVLSELVSNLHDQEPFISVKDKDGNSAKLFFNLARKQEANREFEKAKENYYRAKDFDALRFRAPEDFNVIIKNLASKYSLPLVLLKSYFENESPNGLIGKELMLEHLHPNKDGYFLIAKGFYDTMKENKMISTEWHKYDINKERNYGVTELDSVYAALEIRHLKRGWPFHPKSVPNRFIQTFQPANHLEELAFKIFQNKNYNLQSVHMELGKEYERQGNFSKAFAEYNALITSIPYEIDFYKRAAKVLIKKEEYDKASQLLQRSLKYKETQFANKWVGQIALMNNNYREAISYLSKADLLDSQVVFNLSRAFYLDDQWDIGEEYFNRLQNLSPKSKYMVYLNKLRTLTLMRKNKAKTNQSIE